MWCGMWETQLQLRTPVVEKCSPIVVEARQLGRVPLIYHLFFLPAFQTMTHHRHSHSSFRRTGPSSTISSPQQLQQWQRRHVESTVTHSMRYDNNSDTIDDFRTNTVRVLCTTTIDVLEDQQQHMRYTGLYQQHKRDLFNGEFCQYHLPSPGTIDSPLSSTTLFDECHLLIDPPPSLHPRESFVLWAGEGNEIGDCDFGFTTVFQPAQDDNGAPDESLAAVLTETPTPTTTIPIPSKPTNSTSSRIAVPQQQHHLSDVSSSSPDDASLLTWESIPQRDDTTVETATKTTTTAWVADTSTVTKTPPFTDADVLLGRGGLVNLHAGNIAYRQCKVQLQPRYLCATKDQKANISQELVDAVHAWGGRFMKQNTGDKNHDDDDDPPNATTNNTTGINQRGLLLWYEIDNHTARKKASQTLRERTTTTTATPHALRGCRRRRRNGGSGSSAHKKRVNHQSYRR